MFYSYNNDCFRFVCLGNNLLLQYNSSPKSYKWRKIILLLEVHFNSRLFCDKEIILKKIILCLVIIDFTILK